jgi:uncharacterized protein (TIGR03083 family)
VDLTYAGLLDRSVVVRAAGLVQGLVSRPEVAGAWGRESSCTGMTVGGLARHLVAQPLLVVDLLNADPVPEAPMCALLDNYAGAPWVGDDPEGEAMNRALLERSNAEAGEGPDAALSLLAGAIGRLPSALDEPPATVFVRWLGSRMPTDDFLVTRLMEMVVHADDLAASVGVPTPEFGEDALGPVLGLLTALAVRRHGQDAVVRTLTRPQRAPASISAF